MENKINVSVITVCFNSEMTITDTIESILNQSYNFIEYIIVDGKSTDNTLSIIESYVEKFKKRNISFKWISESDNGIYDAMNKGIAMATGSLIGILNSDDWYASDTISVIVKTDGNNDYCIISGKKTKVNRNKKELKTFQNKKDIKANIQKVMPLNHPATFVHKSVYERIGLFNTKYKLSADYDLIFRAFNEKVNFIFTDEVLVFMRNTGATHQMRSLFITAKEDHLIRVSNNVKYAYYYYLKRICFNCLLVIRNLLKKI